MDIVEFISFENMTFDELTTFVTNISPANHSHKQQLGNYKNRLYKNKTEEFKIERQQRLNAIKVGNKMAKQNNNTAKITKNDRHLPSTIQRRNKEDRHSASTKQQRNKKDRHSASTKQGNKKDRHSTNTKQQRNKKDRHSVSTKQRRNKKDRHVINPSERCKQQ